MTVTQSICPQSGELHPLCLSSTMGLLNWQNSAAMLNCFFPLHKYSCHCVHSHGMVPKLAEINNGSEATVLRLHNPASHMVGETGERGSVHERRAPNGFTPQIGFTMITCYTSETVVKVLVWDNGCNRVRIKNDPLTEGSLHAGRQIHSYLLLDIRYLWCFSSPISLLHMFIIHSPGTLSGGALKMSSNK